MVRRYVLRRHLVRQRLELTGYARQGGGGYRNLELISFD
jgi:hypothetical protein